MSTSSCLFGKNITNGGGGRHKVFSVWLGHSCESYFSSANSQIVYRSIILAFYIHVKHWLILSIGRARTLYMKCQMLSYIQYRD